MKQSEAAKILCCDIFSKGNNEFDGTLSANCQQDFSPQSLKSFVDNLLQGNKINSLHTHLEPSTLTISQMIVHNSMKRLRQDTNTTEMHRAKSRESPLGIYLGMLVHAYTRKKRLVDKLYELGISISYKRVMELSTMIGNRVLRQYDSERLVCPPTLRLNVFTTAALDNIDHNPSSTTSEGSFHGTGISLFQHLTPESEGLKPEFKETNTNNKKLLDLPSVYADVCPVSNFKVEPEITDYSSIDLDCIDLTQTDPTKLEERYAIYYCCQLSLCS